MVRLQKYKDIPLREKPKKPHQPIPLSVVEPQKALLPVFNSPFYLTPDEPADPRDCDRYPDSLFCGGVPWTFTPVGIEPSIVIDDCNIGIEIKPILGWTKLPPVQLVHRKNTPECRLPPEEEFEPPEEFEPYDIPLKFRELGCTRGVAGAICTSVERYGESIYSGNRGGTDQFGGRYERKTIYYEKADLEILEINFPFKTKYRYLDNEAPALFHMKVRITNTRYFNTPIEGIKPTLRDAELDTPSGGTFSRIEDYWIYQNQNIINVGLSQSGLTNIDGDYGSTKIYDDVNRGMAYLRRQRNIQTTVSIDRLEGIGNNARLESKGFTRVTKIPLQLCLDKPKIYFPPIPRQEECDCIMTCCPDTKLNDQLLRMLIKKVDKLSSIVGVDDYPVSLPTSLISKDEGFFGNLLPNENQDVPSLTRFFAWYVERFDEIMGQWEIPIEVKDTDPTKPGDQPVGFRLPNMAEAIAEMFGLMLQTSINTQIGINMQTRTMLEVGQNKQQGFKSYMLVLAIADHLGFDYKEVKHKIPMLFDITQTQLDKLLQESEIEVSAVDYTDKEDLKIVLLELRQAAAIIKAVHWRKFDLKSDVAKGVKDLIMGLVATSDEVNDSKKDEEDGKDKFDDFLEDAERGFTTSSGITDTDHPYGRNYSERPRIKEIGQESPGV